MRQRKEELEFKILPNKYVKITKDHQTSYTANILGIHNMSVGKLYNGKVNPNSVEIIKFFSEQVIKKTPLMNLSSVIEYSQLDTLFYSFETLPISKETYFKVKNQDDETVFVVKSMTLRTSLTTLFGHSEQLDPLKKDIQKVIDDVQKIIRISSDDICYAFSDFEFLIQERNAKTKMFINSKLSNDERDIFNYYDSFKRLSLNFLCQDTPRKTKKYQREAYKKAVTFKDVYCMDDIVSQFREIGDLFKDAKMYHEKGIHIPYGVLLVGEPGSGKTFITRAFANEYGLKLIEPQVRRDYNENNKGIDWVRTFMVARNNAPSIIFIDEIDKINITQELFAEMDGQISNNGVLVIACANDISKMHPGILRPGRIDRKIYFQPLSNETKATMLLKSLEKQQTSYDLDFEYLVEFMGNVNGAYIDTYVNEAKINMLLNNLKEVNNELLIKVIEMVNDGYATPIKYSDEEINQTIVHEAGHAVVALALYGKDAITKIDVRPNYHSSGRVQISSKVPMHNESAILNRVKISLGGLVAEKIMNKEAGLGASSDLIKARYLLQAMIVDYGIIDLKYGGANMFRTIAEQGTEKSKDEAIEIANDFILACKKDVEIIIYNNLDLLSNIIDKLKNKPLLLKNDIHQLHIGFNKLHQGTEQNQL